MNAVERLQYIQKMKALDKKSKQERDAAILEKREQMFAPFLAAMRELHMAGALIKDDYGRPCPNDAYGKPHSPFLLGDKRPTSPCEEFTYFELRWPPVGARAIARVLPFKEDGMGLALPFELETWPNGTGRGQNSTTKPHATVETLIDGFMQAAADHIYLPGQTVTNG